MIKDVKNEEDLVIIISEKGQASLRLGVKVAEILKFEDSIIVRTAAISKERARNIHRYSEDGTKIWTVEEPEGVKDQANAFTGLRLNEKDGIIGYTWVGTKHRIDFATGKLLSSEFTK
ncbi:MAG: hypothetical protein HYU34_03840 [Candidatus Omnitrophica bacterium]|nr:hypothetical protein [Candidatus Omnitrophota bacterium]